MNTERIKEAAQDIAHYELALRWIDMWGASLTGRNGAAFTSVKLNENNDEVGADQAARTIGAYLKTCLPDAVKAARECCINTIAMQKNAIREELGRDGASS